MPKGSEPATWAWAPSTRHCDTCGKELRISDVALFYGISKRGIRCFTCVDARRERFIAETRARLAA